MDATSNKLILVCNEIFDFFHKKQMQGLCIKLQGMKEKIRVDNIAFSISHGNARINKNFCICYKYDKFSVSVWLKKKDKIIYSKERKRDHLRISM